MRLLVFIALVSCCAPYRAPDLIRQSHLRAPIAVWASNDYLEIYEDSLDTAIDEWNRAAGCRLFERTESRFSAKIHVYVSDIRPGVAGGVIMGDPAVVLYNSPADIRHAFVVAAHELGHVIGAQHDRHPMSVMHPNTISDYEALIGDHQTRNFAIVLDHTGRQARELYCNG